MTAHLTPPPDDLLVAEAARARVAVTQVQMGKPGEGGPVVTELALLLEVDGHLNNSTEPRSVRIAMDTAATAKLAAGLLNALDAMRAHPHASPE